jgi:hypothetical protein
LRKIIISSTEYAAFERLLTSNTSFVRFVTVY